MLEETFMLLSDSPSMRDEISDKSVPFISTPSAFPPPEPPCYTCLSRVCALMLIDQRIITMMTMGWIIVKTEYQMRPVLLSMKKLGIMLKNQMIK
jgi:hypothetical protein